MVKWHQRRFLDHPSQCSWIPRGSLWQASSSKQVACFNFTLLNKENYIFVHAWVFVTSCSSWNTSHCLSWFQSTFPETPETFDIQLRTHHICPSHREQELGHCRYIVMGWNFGNHLISTWWRLQNHGISPGSRQRYYLRLNSLGWSCHLWQTNRHSRHCYLLWCLHLVPQPSCLGHLAVCRFWHTPWPPSFVYPDNREDGRIYVYMDRSSDKRWHLGKGVSPLPNCQSSSTHRGSHWQLHTSMIPGVIPMSRRDTYVGFCLYHEDQEDQDQHCSHSC